MEIMPPHLEMSASSSACNLEDPALGKLLEMVFTDANASEARSVDRIWEPTAPVQPNRTAVDMVGFIV